MNIAAASRRNLLLVELREGCRVRKAQTSQRTVALVELNKTLKDICATEKIASVYTGTTQGDGNAGYGSHILLGKRIQRNTASTLSS